MESPGNPVRFNLTHAPSLQAHDRLRYPLPTAKFHVTLDGPQGIRDTPSDFFVGDGCASFATSAGAFNAFLYNDFRESGMSPPSMGVAEVIFADTRGGFEEIVVRPTSMHIQVSGNDSSLRVELSSPTERADTPLPSGRFLELPLVNGLPKACWLWLKKGTEWIDYRSFDGHAASVTFDLPEDPIAGLTALISQGEDQQLEFKSTLPDKRDKDAKRKTFKSVAAFAQDAGGHVIFGVEDRTGVILGIEEDEEAAKQRFESMITSVVRPTPSFELAYQELDGKNLLVAKIHPSGRIHSVVIETDRPEYFIRRNASTFPARPEDLEQVIAARHTPAIPSFLQ